MSMELIIRTGRFFIRNEVIIKWLICFTEHSVSIKDGVFSWDEEDENPTLNG